LKDLSLILHIGELKKAGVASLKIEGRMKRPEYVALAVEACKTALSGKIPDIKPLQDMFSRNGFTDGYYTGNYIDMNGTRTEKDINATKKALNVSGKRYGNRRRIK
jgi:putative protease